MNKRLKISFTNSTWSMKWSLFIPAICLLLAFLVLAFWQYSRGLEKAKIDKTFYQKIKQEAQPIDNIENISNWQKHLYQPTIITGKWLQNTHYLQDNVTNKGQAGYEVLSAFQLKNKVVLINRGWISRNDLPADLNAKTKDTGQQSIQGIWTNPLRRFSLGSSPLPKEYPKIIPEFKINEIAKDLKKTLLPLQLRVNKAQSYSYNIIWSPIFGTAHKHYAYALQWLFFSLILFFLIIKLNYRKNYA